MGRRGHPAEFRRKVLDLVESGRAVAEVAEVRGVSSETIYTWRRQDRIDEGLVPGVIPPQAGGVPSRTDFGVRSGGLQGHRGAAHAPRSAERSGRPPQVGPRQP